MGLHCRTVFELNDIHKTYIAWAIKHWHRYCVRLLISVLCGTTSNEITIPEHSGSLKLTAIFRSEMPVGKDLQ
jgi:hypothetical protein